MESFDCGDIDLLYSVALFFIDRGGRVGKSFATNIKSNTMDLQSTSVHKDFELFLKYFHYFVLDYTGFSLGLIVGSLLLWNFIFEPLFFLMYNIQKIETTSGTYILDYNFTQLLIN